MASNSAPLCRLSRVVIPFEVNPAEATPFTGGTHVERLRAYNASTIATFGTIRRFNPDLVCILATNETPPKRFRDDLASLGVRIEFVPAASSGRLAAEGAFRTSLYLFDVVRASPVASGSATLYLDPDVVCRKAVSFDLRDGQVGYLPLDTPAQGSIKGLTLTDIQQLSRFLPRPLRKLPVHVGGEVLLVTPASLAGLLLRVDECLTSLARPDAPGFANEEHVLTYSREDDWVSLRPIVARVWTSARYRQIPPDVEDLALWHLPAEKTRGLRRIARSVLTGRLDRMQGPDVRRSLARWTGVTPTIARKTSDWLTRQRYAWRRQS